MDKHKIAKKISTFTNPPIICIPLFLIISLVLSGFDINKFISLELVSVVFTSVLPMAIIIRWARKTGDSDISNPKDRFIPLIVGVISYFIGFCVSYILNLHMFLTILLLCYSINTAIVMIITLKWKISIHTTGLSGPVAALILLLGPWGAVLGVIYPVLIWSRVVLKKHTLAQAICGGVQGFFLSVVEMYLFSCIFKLNIVSLANLEMSVLYILAIIYAPVILGILSYSDVNNKKLIFILFEIIGLGLFIAFTPLSVIIIYILVSLTSVFISYFAGSEFVWFNVLNSS